MHLSISDCSVSANLSRSIASSNWVASDSLMAWEIKSGSANCKSGWWNNSRLSAYTWLIIWHTEAIAKRRLKGIHYRVVMYTTMITEPDGKLLGIVGMEYVDRFHWIMVYFHWSVVQFRHGLNFYVISVTGRVFFSADIPIEVLRYVRWEVLFVFKLPNNK